MNPEDVQKTAVITPFGLFEFLRMPFGLKNAAQTFQRFMDSILQDLDFVFVYLNDISVASKSEEEHKRHLEVLFDRLEAHGIVVKVEKCLFGVTQIEFLGHSVDAKESNHCLEKLKLSEISQNHVMSKALNVFRNGKRLS